MNNTNIQTEEEEVKDLKKFLEESEKIQMISYYDKSDYSENKSYRFGTVENIGATVFNAIQSIDKFGIIATTEGRIYLFMNQTPKTEEVQKTENFFQCLVPILVGLKAIVIREDIKNLTESVNKL